MVTFLCLKLTAHWLLKQDLNADNSHVSQSINQNLFSE